MNSKRLMAIVLSAALQANVSAATEWPNGTELLGDAELALLRGGFVFDGLQIAIGLEQAISVDGTELVVTRLSIPNLNQRAPGRGLTHSLDAIIENLDPMAGGQLSVYQSTDPGRWVSIIQNSLNGLVIQNVRQLNIELNNLGPAYRIPRDIREPSLLR